MERSYICTGLGKSYSVSAKTSNVARYRAGLLYKGDVDAPYPAAYYAQYFSPRIVNPGKPGRKVLLPILV